MRIGKHIINPTWGNIKVWKNKSIEWQIAGPKTLKRFTDEYFLFDIHRMRGDHGGIYSEFSLFKLFWIEINFYDHRHWDHHNGCWEK